MSGLATPFYPPSQPVPTRIHLIFHAALSSLVNGVFLIWEVGVSIRAASLCATEI